MNNYDFNGKISPNDAIDISIDKNGNIVAELKKVYKIKVTPDYLIRVDKIYKNGDILFHYFPNVNCPMISYCYYQYRVSRKKFKELVSYE